MKFLDLATENDENTLDWLRRNLDVVRIPAMIAMLNHFAQLKVVSAVRTPTGEEVETGTVWNEAAQRWGFGRGQHADSHAHTHDV